MVKTTNQYSFVVFQCNINSVNWDFPTSKRPAVAMDVVSLHVFCSPHLRTSLQRSNQRGPDQDKTWMSLADWMETGIVECFNFVCSNGLF
jgi:hypothetical protein